MDSVLFWSVFLEPTPQMGFRRALLHRLSPPGTALSMPLAVSLSSLYWRQLWRYLSGYSSHGRWVGGLSIVLCVPYFLSCSFSLALIMRYFLPASCSFALFSYHLP